MFTLRQMRFLVALADTLNFSQAAEVCFVTQPTLSAGIKELEAILGVQLFERTKRSVLLTPVGAKVAERARRLLLDAGEITTLADAHRNPFQGDLRLGCATLHLDRSHNDQPIHVDSYDASLHNDRRVAAARRRETIQQHTGGTQLGKVAVATCDIVAANPEARF